jgi:FtsP/CotA-like multicopper oxidase with cupredoxin domain
MAMTVVLIGILLAVHPPTRALATSGISPYVIPDVTDTNAAANIVETSLVAKEATVDIGNGVSAHAETFNGTIPGPTFHLKVGDTVIVHYVNHLPYASGIHWHGIELENSMDGTPFTQDKVPPGGTFLYKFKVPPRPGIFWYHPHHHSSTNQVFKGLYGMIIVTDPNLISSTVLPAQTLPIVLSDTTVCKTPGSNDALTYDPSLPWKDGLSGPLPAQAGPHPVDLCQTAPLDENGAPRAAGAFAAGDIPNIQTLVTGGREVEGQTVLTNGMNVGGRLGTPSAPGALVSGGPPPLPVQAGQGLRLQILNAAAIRYFRLRLTGNSGQIPLFRVGGEGGLLDNPVLEGGMPGGFDTGYSQDEILLPPGSRADVVAAIPATASGVLTLWTEDYSRTGMGFSDIPSVPVMHLSVSGSVTPYTISTSTPLRTSPVVPLGPATSSLLDPSTFSPPKTGQTNGQPFVTQNITHTTQIQNITLTANGGGPAGIDTVFGTHDVAPPYWSPVTAPHLGSTRYAKVGDILELTVENLTGAHHPFHLHGFSMQPLSLTKPSAQPYVWPYHEFRDNIDIPPGYTLHFRIRIDDRPLANGTTMGGALGRWLFHCHIFFHATNGMLGELVVVNANGNEKPDVNTVADSFSSTGTTTQVMTAGLTATMDGTYHDPDGDPVTLASSEGAVTDTGGGTWTWTENATGSGSRLIYITATDSHGLKDQAVFRLKVGTLPDGSDDGDPHVRTVDGTHYDFQSVGEFTLLRDAEDGLEIQTRQTPVTTATPVTDSYTGLTACVSVNTGVAAQVGAHRVAYEPVPGEKRPLRVYVDGTLRTLPPTGIDLGSGGRVIPYSLSGGVQAVEIDFPDQTVLTVSPWFWTANNLWLLNVDAFHTGADQGIMGSVRQGWLPALPNGASLGSRPAAPASRYVELDKVFANAWRVTGATSLFTYAPGTSTGTFSYPYPGWPPPKPPCKVPRRFVDKRAHPSGLNIAPKLAIRYCKPVTVPDLNRDCVFDVETTGDPTVVKSYQQSQEIKLRASRTRVTANREPTLLGKPVTFTATVTPMASGKAIPGGVVRFTVDGSAVSPKLSLDKRGKAAWTTSKLTAGAHEVAASYSPNVNTFLASSSPRIVHTVKGPVNPCKNVALTMPSGPGKVGGTDPNTTFRTGPGQPFGPAFIVAPAEGWDTILKTNWVSINASHASAPPESGFPYRTVFERTFALPPGSPNRSQALSLTVTVLADDGATVFLNDHVVGAQPCEDGKTRCTGANSRLSPENTFTDSTQSDFLPGVNTLKLRVLDQGPPNVALDYLVTLACAPAKQG